MGTLHHAGWETREALLVYYQISLLPKNCSAYNGTLPRASFTFAHPRNYTHTLKTKMLWGMLTPHIMPKGSVQGRR
jgi:hypothetical protein